jgi:hypothetical protein
VGHGDLLFINDLFPKDWNSFFIGRDDEYLKAPSDSAKASFFSDWANLDVIYSPRFDSDRYIDGRRISYWNGQRLAGRDDEVDADKPDDVFEDDEWAARLYRSVGAYEVATYPTTVSGRVPSDTIRSGGGRRFRVCRSTARARAGPSPKAF